MDILTKIESLLEAPLEEKGYGIVRVSMQGAYRNTLQLMIEKLDESGITIDDCAEVSRLATVLLDHEQLMSDNQLLEVSSPGLDRPLVKPKDFVRFLGAEVKVKFNRAIEGRRKFKGRLAQATETGIVLEGIDERNEPLQLSLDYTDLQSAKLEINFD